MKNFIFLFLFIPLFAFAGDKYSKDFKEVLKDVERYERENSAVCTRLPGRCELIICPEESCADCYYYFSCSNGKVLRFAVMGECCQQGE